MLARLFLLKIVGVFFNGEVYTDSSDMVGRSSGTAMSGYDRIRELEAIITAMAEKIRLMATQPGRVAETHRKAANQL